MRIALARFVPVRFAPARLAPESFASDRFAPARSAPGSIVKPFTLNTTPVTTEDSFAVDKSSVVDVDPHEDRANKNKTDGSFRELVMLLNVSFCHFEKLLILIHPIEYLFNAFYIK